MELPSFNIKIFPKESCSYISENGNSEKRSFPYISGNGNHEKLLYISGNGVSLYYRERKPKRKRKRFIFQESNFPSLKNKKIALNMFIIPREMELFTSGLKKVYFIFQEELSKSQKQKFLIFFQPKL